MNLQENRSLTPYNTFGIDVKAEYLVEVHSEEELIEALRLRVEPIFLLGGGSNLLLTKDIPGLVIVNRIAGKEILKTEKNTVFVKVGGGENWHNFVLWCLENDYGGIENLSLIPGTVGAAPIQNIGAYGVELKDVFHKLDAIHLESLEKKAFYYEDCQFGYRDSIFKKQLKGQYCITSVQLKLTYHQHQINTSYGAIQNQLKKMGVDNPGIRDISKAVVDIRSSKLPNPAELGNSGSFFKNPVISNSHFVTLKKQFPDIVSYPQIDGTVKVPAGWLIDRAGWKGKRKGDVASYHKQALVLVNYGQASGREILDFAQEITQSVKNTYGILLEPEVNII